MKTLVDFIIEMPADPTLAEEAKKAVVDAASADDLKKWFSSKGYEVAENECIRLIENKVKLEQAKIGY